MADVKAEIEALLQKINQDLQAGKVDTMADYYTEDCKLLPPFVPMVVGKEALKKFFDEAKFFEKLSKVESTVVEVLSSGDTATTISKAVMYGKDGKASDETKSMTVWKKVDGAWKLHYNIWNSDKPWPETPK